MNALGTLILVILIVVVLLGPRRWAVLGMLSGVLYLTQAQQVTVMELNLYAMRFLELAGFVRVVVRREFTLADLNRMDGALVVFYSYLAIVYWLRATEGQVYVLGLAVDAVLCYFTFRGLIRHLEDLRWCLRALILLLAPYAAMVLIESLTRQNLFTFVGGGAVGGWARGDRFRSVGSFRGRPGPVGHPGHQLSAIVHRAGAGQRRPQIRDRGNRPLPGHYLGVKLGRAAGCRCLRPGRLGLLESASGDVASAPNHRRRAGAAGLGDEGPGLVFAGARQPGHGR